MNRKSHAIKRIKERLGMNVMRPKTRRTINRDIRSALSCGSVMLDQTGCYVVFGSIGTYIISHKADVVTVLRDLSNPNIDERFSKKISSFIPILNTKKILLKFYPIL